MDRREIDIKRRNKKEIESAECIGELFQYISQLPEVAKPLVLEAEDIRAKIEKSLLSAPAMINVVKATVPDTVLQAVLTDEQKQQIVKGALKIMAKKDGSLIAKLINPKTKRIVTNIPLKSVKMTPEMTQAMTSFSTQIQLAQIAEQIQTIQRVVEEVRQGQESDRLAS